LEIFCAKSERGSLPHEGRPFLVKIREHCFVRNCSSGGKKSQTAVVKSSSKKMEKSRNHHSDQSGSVL